MLRTLASSRIRMGILEALGEPMRLSELRRVVGTNAPNTSTKAKDLEAMGLIERDNGGYMRTRAGKLVNSRLSLLSDTLESLCSHWEFWAYMLNHLPPELVERIHEFKDAKLVRNSRQDPDVVRRLLLRSVTEANGCLTVVLPVMWQDILSALETRGNGTKVSTVIDCPELRYGLISSKGSTILFTEALDIALVNSVQLPSSSSRMHRTGPFHPSRRSSLVAAHRAPQ